MPGSGQAASQPYHATWTWVKRAVAIWLVATCFCWRLSAADARRPIAVSAPSDSQVAFVANRQSGTICVIDTSLCQVVAEIEVDGKLSDLAALEKHRVLLALDGQNHQLVVIRKTNGQWQVIGRHAVAEHPVRILWHAASQRCFVASLWSRSVSVLQLRITKRNIQVTTQRALRLPFEPRELCATVSGDRLFAASAYDAQVALVDVQRWKVVLTKDLPGHNIRGLAVSDDQQRLLMAQQELNPIAHSSRDDVHWGNMISNVLVTLPISHFCSPSTDILAHRTVHRLGGPGDAAGDPGQIISVSPGKVAVLLGGVHQIAILDEQNGRILRRIAVGQRPVSGCVTRNERLLVVNMYSDSVSVIDLVNLQHVRQIFFGERSALSLAEKGEAMFFDSRLSHDGWMSCHSCHTDGHSNGQLNDNLSDGSFSASKRVLSLLGAADTGPWAWTGGIESLDRQVASSVQHTMQGEPASAEQVAALVAYVKTLSPPPLMDSPAINSDLVATGKDLFVALECNRCHVPPTFTSPATYDVGLTDLAGNRQFNPPSLRGVARRGAFFHDGRVTELADVFRRHQHQLERQLNDAELVALLTFLQSI